jgi:hypothetical protein
MRLGGPSRSGNLSQLGSSIADVDDDGAESESEHGQGEGAVLVLDVDSRLVGTEPLLVVLVGTDFVVQESCDEQGRDGEADKTALLLIEGEKEDGEGEQDDDEDDLGAGHRLVLASNPWPLLATHLSISK